MSESGVFGAEGEAAGSGEVLHIGRAWFRMTVVEDEPGDDAVVQPVGFVGTSPFGLDAGGAVAIAASQPMTLASGLKAARSLFENPIAAAAAARPATGEARRSIPLPWTLFVAAMALSFAAGAVAAAMCRAPAARIIVAAPATAPVVATPATAPVVAAPAVAPVAAAPAVAPVAELVPVVAAMPAAARTVAVEPIGAAVVAQPSRRSIARPVVSPIPRVRTPAARAEPRAPAAAEVASSAAAWVDPFAD